MNAKSQSHDATRTLDQRRRRFEELYAENQGRVFGYVLRRTDHADDAADLIAETFLTAWRRLDDIPAGDEARLWLYGVARRVLANHRRGDRRRYELAARLRIELASAHGPLEYTGELAEVAAAFRRLADGDREVLALEGWEGLDPAGIAAVLGARATPQGSACTALVADFPPNSPAACLARSRLGRESSTGKQREPSTEKRHEPDLLSQQNFRRRRRTRRRS